MAAEPKQKLFRVVRLGLSADSQPRAVPVSHSPGVCLRFDPAPVAEPPPYEGLIFLRKMGARTHAYTHTRTHAREGRASGRP
jgi:hypothetical protein